MRACERWERDLALHASGDLAPARAARLDAHLASCVTCRERLRRYERDQATLGAFGTDPVAEDALWRVRAGVRQGLPDECSGVAPRQGGVFAAAAVGLSALAIVVAVLVLLRPRPTPQSASRPASAGVTVEPSVSPVVEQAVPEPAPTPSARRSAAAAAAPARSPAEPEVPALSPEEADQLVRALVYVSQLDRLPTADEEPQEEMPAPSARLARFETDDPNVVIYWLMESNGGSS
jgi:hypothetical protein